MGPGGGPGRHGYQKPKNLRGTLGKLMRYLGRYKAALCLVAVLLVISSACTVGGSYLIKPLINDYILPGDFAGLAKMLLFMGCVYVVGALCSFGYARIMVHVSQNTVARIRSDLFDRMQQLPLKYFDTHTHGELMSRYTNDIETISEALNNSFGSLISCSLNFTGTIIMMLVLSPLLTFITFGMLVIMLLVVKVIGSRSRRYFAGQQAAITSLINRFYEIQSGTITYDGIDVRDISKDSLRASLGVVLQDTHLFTGTVADNIRYGRLDATDEEVVAAAKLANADAFIRHLPQGYDTLLTDDGGNLSQGERQLLNIARAAISNPPVLILDEATSSIDTHTEKLIEQGMDHLMAGRTVFVIAHRLSTVRNAKAIMVLEQGRIIERGDHDELLKQHGRYYQLYTGQAELS